MWIILKYKKKQINHLLDSFKKILVKKLSFIIQKLNIKNILEENLKLFQKKY